MRIFGSITGVFITVALIICVPASRSRAGQSGDPADLSLEELMNIQAISTKVATKTEMDSDLTPGIVTVLTGRKLESMGVQTVWDALALIPGFNLNPDGMTQNRSIIVRGLGGGYSSGEVKYLMDGIPWNQDANGQVGATAIPIEAIDRIEVIRGPGSALYGEYAFAGIVNVVTRRDVNKVYLKYGSFNSRTAGGVFSYSNPEKQFDVSLNFSSLTHGKTGLVVQQDGLYGTPNQGVSQAPGELNDNWAGLDGSFRADYKELYVEAIYSNYRQGNGLEQFTNVLKPPSDSLNEQFGSRLIEAGWKPQLTVNLMAKLYAGDRTFNWNFDNYYIYPPGYVGASANGPNTLYPNGMIANGQLNEESNYFNGELYYDGFINQKIVAGAGYQQAMVLNAGHATNYNPLTAVPLPQITTFSGSTGQWLAGNLKRYITSVFVQDQLRANDRLKMTASARYDGYSDAGASISPRLAAVYEMGGPHIIKVQYAGAFRPPNWKELGDSNSPPVLGNPNLKAETIKTSELEYMYKGEANIFKATAFYSDLENLIAINANSVFQNHVSAYVSGAEGELETSLGDGLKFSANVSYTASALNGSPIPDSTPWLGNAWLLYQPRHDLTANLRYQYVGPVFISQGSPSIPQYGIFSLTVLSRNFFVKGLSLNAGLNNLFNATIVVPALINNAYNLPQPGRSAWVGMQYNFDAK